LANQLRPFESIATTWATGDGQHDLAAPGRRREGVGVRNGHAWRRRRNLPGERRLARPQRGYGRNRDSPRRRRSAP